MIKTLLISFLFLGMAACVSAKTVASGKTTEGCSSNDQKIAINPNNRQFPAQMDKCGSDAWGDAQKTLTCIQKSYPKLSKKCASCFAEMTHCSAQNCKSKCIGDHFSEKCLQCVETTCRDKKPGNKFSVVHCTGLTKEELPPRKS